MDLMYLLKFILLVNVKRKGDEKMSSVFYYTKESIKNFKELRHLQLVGQEDKILTEEEKKEQGKLNLYLYTI